MSESTHTDRANIAPRSDTASEKRATETASGFDHRQHRGRAMQPKRLTGRLRGPETPPSDIRHSLQR